MNSWWFPTRPRHPPQQTGEAMTEAAIFAAGITLGAVVIVLALNLKREK